MATTHLMMNADHSYLSPQAKDAVGAPPSASSSFPLLMSSTMPSPSAFLMQQHDNQHPQEYGAFAGSDSGTSMFRGDIYNRPSYPTPTSYRATPPTPLLQGKQKDLKHTIKEEPGLMSNRVELTSPVTPNVVKVKLEDMKSPATATTPVEGDAASAMLTLKKGSPPSAGTKSLNSITKHILGYTASTLTTHSISLSNNSVSPSSNDLIMFPPFTTPRRGNLSRATALPPPAYPGSTTKSGNSPNIMSCLMPEIDFGSGGAAAVEEMGRQSVSNGGRIFKSGDAETIRDAAEVMMTLMESPLSITSGLPSSNSARRPTFTQRRLDTTMPSVAMSKRGLMSPLFSPSPLSPIMNNKHTHNTISNVPKESNVGNKRRLSTGGRGNGTSTSKRRRSVGRDGESGGTGATTIMISENKGQDNVRVMPNGLKPLLGRKQSFLVKVPTYSKELVSKTVKRFSTGMKVDIQRIMHVSDLVAALGEKVGLKECLTLAQDHRLCAIVVCNKNYVAGCSFGKQPKKAIVSIIPIKSYLEKFIELQSGESVVISATCRLCDDVLYQDGLCRSHKSSVNK
eukprot:m.6112 g.6112  ORF g.6112 m.6112 type:complete len:567 (-) comp3486_c0_seq2:299-1999(-)